MKEKYYKLFCIVYALIIYDKAKHTEDITNWNGDTSDCSKGCVNCPYTWCSNFLSYNTVADRKRINKLNNYR